MVLSLLKRKKAGREAGGFSPSSPRSTRRQEDILIVYTAVVGGVAVNKVNQEMEVSPQIRNCRRPNTFGNKLTTFSLLYIYLETRYTAIRQSFLTVYIVLEWWDIDHQCLLCYFKNEFRVRCSQRAATTNPRPAATTKSPQQSEDLKSKLNPGQCLSVPRLRILN